MRKALNKLLICFLSLLTVFGLSIMVVNGQTFIKMFPGDNFSDVLLYNIDPFLLANFSGNNIIWIIVFVFCFKLIENALKIKEKRLNICAIIPAILFAVFVVIGNCINFSLSIKLFFDYFVIFTIKLIGLIILFYSAIIVLFTKLSKYDKIEDIKQFNIFTDNKKSIAILGLIIFIFWVPYFLKEFPGIIMYDSIYQIQQAIGIEEFNYHHPVIHTFFIKICLAIGEFLFHSINAGVAIYTIAQMAIMAYIFSYIIYYMAKKGVNTWIRLIISIYFAICPIFPLMSIAMNKDTIFSGLMAISLIIFIELIINTEKFFKSKRNIIFSLLILMITILFRNNALYSFALTIPFIAIFKKGYRLKVTIFLFSSIICVVIINFIIIHGFHVEKTSEIEMYSVPLQQLTRVIVDNNEKMNDSEKKEISKFFYSDYFYKSYKNYISDPIKDSVNRSYFAENKTQFFKLWLKLLFKYPKSYIDAFLGLTSGYFDAEESRVSICYGVLTNELGIENKPIYNLYIVDFIEKLVYAQYIPIIGLFYNNGLALWILIILLAYNIYKKQSNESLTFLPIILYFFTILLGPLNNEFRYVSFLYTCVPIYSVITFKKILIDKKI